VPRLENPFKKTALSSLLAAIFWQFFKQVFQPIGNIHAFLILVAKHILPGLKKVSTYPLFKKTAAKNLPRSFEGQKTAQ
jgi:hypothetical protein